MSFTYLLMIPGWFTDIRLRRGRDGIRIREYGLAGLIFRSDLALESVGAAVLDGDGAIGDSTGITITQGLTTGGITPGAERFITGVPMLVADLPGAVVSSVGVVSTAGVGPGRSTEIGRRHEDTLLRTGRAG